MSVRIGAALTFVGILFTSVAFGAQTVAIEVLNPPSDNIAAGYYIGPYQALLNGSVPTTVICDDFAADTPMNSPWDATVMTVADLTDPLTADPVRWTTSTVATYQQAAWLALQLNSASASSCFSLTGNCAADIQFAIWSLFDPDAKVQYTNNGPSLPIINTAAVNTWLGLAAANYKDPGVNYADVLIYTPKQLVGGPQEFLSVTTPEPSTLFLLALNALGVVGLVWLTRKRTAQN